MNITRGIIALDIDGTITDNIHSVPEPVVSYLKQLQEEGWGLVFVTGRTFAFGYRALKALNFPYLFVMQNGADILEMPSRRVVHSARLPSSVIPLLEKATPDIDFLIYAGYEKGDFCYYRPSRHTKTMLTYFEKIKALAPEPWQAVENFTFSPTATFPLIKYFGPRESMRPVNHALSQVPGVHVTMIHDPIDQSHYVILVTDAQATKGKALQHILKISGDKHPLIAAGDDYNDLSMLEVADIGIAMQTAPQEVLSQADIIAPPASENGIITGLQTAIKLWD